MRCKIADLITELPEAGDLIPRCQAYLCDSVGDEAVRISKEDFRLDAWNNLVGDFWVYMESGSQFYGRLIKHGGLMLHASAVELNGNAYLFSGHCGVGKSTHTRLWQKTFGASAQVFNDDKPALRYLDGRWYAYGTPWCGKDGININMKAPLAGICFLKQAQENRIRRLSAREAVQLLLPQTMWKYNDGANTLLLMEHLDNLIREIPIFELENRPEPEAALLSCETMRRAAEEAGL